MGKLAEVVEILFSGTEAGSREVTVNVSENVRRAGATVEAQSIKLRKSSEGPFSGKGSIVLSPPNIDVRITVKGVPGLSVESSIEINNVKKTQTDRLTAEIETFQHLHTFSDFNL